MKFESNFLLGTFLLAEEKNIRSWQGASNSSKSKR